MSTYEHEVERILTVGPDSTRGNQRGDPIFSEEELEEMEDMRLLGTPAREFAARLINRDISYAEYVSDPYPQREYPEVPMN